MLPALVHSAKSTSATSSRLDEDGLARGRGSPATKGGALRARPDGHGASFWRRSSSRSLKPRADAPDVAERAVRLEDAEQQRADRRAAPALAGQPSADHELLAAEGLDLQPLSRRAGPGS